jgi:hypothetical protein
MSSLAADAPRPGDLVERYLKRLETYGKPSSVRTHRVVSGNLLRFFKRRPVESLTSVDLEAFYAFSTEGAKREASKNALV